MDPSDDITRTLKFESTLTELEALYSASFNPTVEKSAHIPCDRSIRRSSRVPIWKKPPRPKFTDGSPLLECMNEEKPLYEYLRDLARNGRILFLSFSLSGLTTNLQSLISLHDDIISIRPDVDIWLGFRLGSARQNPRLGQITRNGVEWSFYQLAKLRACIVGQDKDARYEMLVRLLFCMQKVKEEYVILFEHFDGCIVYSLIVSRNAKSKTSQYHAKNPLGEKTGRLSDTSAVEKFLESLVQNDESSADEDDDEDEVGETDNDD